MLVLALSCTLITSCWSAREIDQLAFIVAMGVDKEDDLIKLTVQVVVGGGGSGGEGEGSGAPVWITSVTGNSLSEAVFSLHRIISKTPFLSHSYVLILGEDLARDGIAEVLDWVGRDREMRNSLQVAVALGSAEDIIKVEPKMTQLPAEYIEALLRLGVETGQIPNAHLLQMRVAYANRPALQIMMPLIQPQPQEDTGGGSGGENPAAGAGGSSSSGEEQKPESIELKGTAVFRDDKMVGTLDLRESRGVAWLTGQISDTLVTINRQEGQVTQNVDFAQAKYRLRESGANFVLEARVTQDGVLKAWPLGTDQGITPTILAQLENDLVRVIEEEIRAALTKLQKDYNADVLGLGERLRRLDSDLYKSLNWDEAFPSLQLATDIKASFRRIGLTK